MFRFEAFGRNCICLGNKSIFKFVLLVSCVNTYSFVTELILTISVLTITVILNDKYLKWDFINKWRKAENFLTSIKYMEMAFLEILTSKSFWEKKLICISEV